MTRTDERDHIEAAELAAYLDGGLPDARKEDVEVHLAGCPACRAELVEVSGIVTGHEDTSLGSHGPGGLTPSRPAVPDERGTLDEIPSVGTKGRRRWARWLAGAGGLAAAAAAAMILLSQDAPREGAGPDRLRSGPQVTDEIVRLTPLDAQARITEEGVALELSWEPAADDLTYRVSVTDAAGELVASTETAESSVTLDAVGGASSGDLLFWYVDATLANGESASTGVQSLTVP